VSETVGKAYELVFHGLNHFCIASIGPFCLSILATTLISSVLSDFLLFIVVIFFELVPMTIFAVSWHRYVLIGPERAPPRLIPSWSKVHWRFVGYTIVVGYLVMIGALLAMSIAVSVFSMIFALVGVPENIIGFVSLIAIPGLLYPSLRLSLVLPSTAVGARVRLGESWRYTSGEGWRLVGVTLLAMAPLVGIFLIQFLFVGGDGSSATDALDSLPITNFWIVDQVIWAVPTYLSMALTVTVLSLAFRHRTEWQPPKAERRPVRDP
jgi:hypothetical protein